MRKNVFLLISIVFTVFSVRAVCEESDTSSGRATPLSATDVVATFTFDGKTIPVTVADYQNEMRSQSLSLTGKAAEEFLPGYVREGVKKAGSRLIVLELARKEGLQNDPQIRREVESYRDQLLTVLLEKQVSEEAPKVTEQEIEDRYRRQRILYRTPERCEIIRIHSFYENPEDAEEMGEARERVEEALKKVNEGADFVRIAKDYSTGPSTAKGEPIAVDPKEVNPALAEAIGNLKLGEHSGVVEVRHGYTIVKLLDRTPAGYKPLEVVRGEIRAELETKAKRSHAAKYFRDYDNKLAPKKHYEKFDGGDDKTILFELADVEFTKGDFLKTIADSEDKETLTSSQEMREGKLNRILQQKMRIHAARSRGIDQDATFISRMKGIENDVLYARMLSRLANERKNESEITEEDLKEAYESLKDRLLSDKEVRIQALQFKIEMDRPGFRPPSKKAQADVYWKARSVAKRVQAGEDFTEVIKECDPDQGDGIMGVQPLGRYAPRFREAIDKLAVGEVSDPILTDDGFIFYVIKLLEVKEPRKLAFEESKDLLKPNVSRQKMQKTQQNVLDELAGKYNLTVDEGNVAGLLSP